MVLRFFCILLVSLPLYAASVSTGLDNVNDYQDLFRNKGVGIVTNHTAFDLKGRYIVDIFVKMEDVKVAALFGPEHGIKGFAAAGLHIDDETFMKYDIPVYSLYGSRRKPSAEMLKGIDVLVYDIQDIGARFYTYISTMAMAMEAAAENGIRFVVLDRPNPINGVDVQGPVLQQGFSSFVGMFPIPVRHGMTSGELAEMINRERWLSGGIKADLTVIKMKGWKRQLWYDESSIPFIRPSPNMTNLDTATVYPGICLVEGTNISEGRGTQMPFQQIGAPWIEAPRLEIALNGLNIEGVKFTAISFVPQSSKHSRQKCFGVSIRVTDRTKLDSFWMGAKVVETVYNLYPEKFEWRDRFFDKLCGTDAVRKAIVGRQSLDKLKTRCEKDLLEFIEVRKKYLLY